MSCIRSKDTKPEMLVRRHLFSAGFRYKLHDKKLPGKPDIVLPKYRTVIFIHGCFWHGHEGCRHYVIPKTRSEWWLNKITSNKIKDSSNNHSLKNDGWKILTIWECDLKPKIRESTLSTLSAMIRA